MLTCVVKGCKSSKSSKGSSVRFHAFPSNEALRELWWSNIKPKRMLKGSTKICELHFDPEDYDEMKRLKRNAVPRASREDRAESCDSPSVVEKVCRICLASDRTVFDLRDRGLRQAYSDASGITATLDCLPQALCWECSARVRAAARLRSRARAAQRALLALMETHGGAITREAVSSVIAREKNLATQLSCKLFNCYDYDAYIGEFTEENDMKPLHKLDVDIENEVQPEFVEEFVDEIQDIDEDRIDVIEDIGDKDCEEDDDIIYHEVSDAKNDEGGDSDVEPLNDSDDDGDDVKSKLKNATNHTNVVASNDTDVKSKLKNATNDRMMSNILRRTLFIKDFTITEVNPAEQIAALERRKEKTSYKTAVYKCEVCYLGYKDEARYEAHVIKHTDKYGTFECLVCKTRYTSRGMLRKHVVAFHTKKYSCNKCSLVTFHSTTARNHVNFHDGTIFKCPHCPLQFQKRTSYYSHLRLKHACAEVCEYCGHTFLNKYGAMRHKSLVHKFDKDTVPLVGPRCDACDVKFASQQAYDKHLTMSSKHRKEDESQEPITNAYYRPSTNRNNREDKKRNKHPINCEQCGLTLSSRSMYAWHFKEKHPGQTRTEYPSVRTPHLMCEQCGRTFAIMSHLKDHKWVHTGKKHFKCDSCGKTFITKSHLVAHMRFHDAVPPSYECPICGKHFPYHHNRKRHMFIHTGLKPYKCGNCDKSFTTAGEHRSHVDHVHLNMPWPRRDRRRGLRTRREPDHTED